MLVTWWHFYLCRVNIITRRFRSRNRNAFSVIRGNKERERIERSIRGLLNFTDFDLCQKGLKRLYRYVCLGPWMIRFGNRDESVNDTQMSKKVRESRWNQRCRHEYDSVLFARVYQLFLGYEITPGWNCMLCSPNDSLVPIHILGSKTVCIVASSTVSFYVFNPFPHFCFFFYVGILQIATGGIKSFFSNSDNCEIRAASNSRMKNTEKIHHRRL